MTKKRFPLAMSAITGFAGPPRAQMSVCFKRITHVGIDLGGGNSATLAKDPRLPEPSGELESIAYTNFNAAGIPPPRRRALSHDMADLLPGFIASKGFGAGVTLRA